MSDTCEHGVNFYKKRCYICRPEKPRLKVEDCPPHIRIICEYAENQADFMEGANMPDFKDHETRMVAALEILELLGLNFNPMNGILKSGNSKQPKVN